MAASRTRQRPHPGQRRNQRANNRGDCARHLTRCTKALQRRCFSRRQRLEERAGIVLADPPFNFKLSCFLHADKGDQLIFRENLGGRKVCMPSRQIRVDGSYFYAIQLL